MKRIMFFLLDDKENKVETILTNHTKIMIIRGSRSYLLMGRPGARCNTVYVDGELNTKMNEEWITCVLKPMCIPYGGELIFI